MPAQRLNCSFSLLDEGRQYTGNHRKYIIENAREICNSPATKEKIRLREALGFYGQRNWVYGPRNWGWKKAIEQTEAYYREADPGLRGGILQLRYMERRTREEVMDKLSISYSTYQKAHSDLLSTIAVFAAHYGEL